MLRGHGRRRRRRRGRSRPRSSSGSTGPTARVPPAARGSGSRSSSTSSRRQAARVEAYGGRGAPVSRCAARFLRPLTSRERSPLLHQTFTSRSPTGLDARESLADSPSSACSGSETTTEDHMLTGGRLLGLALPRRSLPSTAGCGGRDEARLGGTIDADGSSTVGPYVTAAAEKLPRREPGRPSRSAISRHRWRLRALLPWRDRPLERLPPDQGGGGGDLPRRTASTTSSSRSRTTRSRSSSTRTTTGPRA